ncbi:hypothetical protein ACWEOE_27830 [Amycolatopsis sp. NPDC004368]
MGSRCFEEVEWVPLWMQEEFDNHFTVSPVWTELLAAEGELSGVVEFPSGEEA